MHNDFEDLVAQFGAGTSDRSLVGLEARVWSRIVARQRLASPAAIWGWRSAAAALLLTIGVVAGGATVGHVSPELALFSSQPALAPSTLLGESR